jgi:hypothetical protein
VDTAIVELDPLADTVRTTSQDDDLGLRGRPGLILLLVGGVVVRRVGLELRRAGVEELVNRDDSGLESGGLGSPPR